MKVGRLKKKLEKFGDETDVCIEAEHKQYDTAYATRINITASSDPRRVLLLVAGKKVRI